MREFHQENRGSSTNESVKGKGIEKKKKKTRFIVQVIKEAPGSKGVVISDLSAGFHPAKHFVCVHKGRQISEFIFMLKHVLAIFSKGLRSLKC